MYIYIPDTIILPLPQFIILMVFAVFGISAFFFVLIKYNAIEHNKNLNKDIKKTED